MGALGPARHAPHGLRLRGHERGRLRPGLPRARGRRQRCPQLRVGAGLAGHVPDLEVRLARSRSRSGCRAWPPARSIGCFGLTEPDSGSDPSSMRTTRPPRRRRLDPQRHQDVDHQRRRSPTSPSCGPAPTTADGGAVRRLRRPDRHARLRRQRHPQEALAARRRSPRELVLDDVRLPDSARLPEVSTRCAARSRA